MNELIPLNEYNGEKAVSARKLHSFLESKQDFSDWIKGRIKKYGFIENQDFVVFHNFMENPKGGRPLTEYILTLDCAKELSMVEGNEKGKQARRYFIQCERKSKEVKHLPVDPDTTKSRIIVANWMIDCLKPNEASKLLIVKSIADPLGLPTPEYVESKGVLKCATDLLKIHNPTCYTRTFNQLMINKGFMIENQRASTSSTAKNGIKLFKTLTDEGLEYGENLVNPHNQKETQPYYYEDKFSDLLLNLNLKNIA